MELYNALLLEDLSPRVLTSNRIRRPISLHITSPPFPEEEDLGRVQAGGFHGEGE